MQERSFGVQEGRKMLDTMATFLKGVDSRIVISEIGPVIDGNNSFFGLPRALEVVDYLTNQSGLDKKRFSLSSASTLSDESSENTEAGRPVDSGRTLEITLLDRSLYN